VDSKYTEKNMMVLRYRAHRRNKRWKINKNVYKRVFFIKKRL